MEERYQREYWPDLFHGYEIDKTSGKEYRYVGASLRVLLSDPVFGKRPTGTEYFGFRTPIAPGSAKSRFLTQLGVEPSVGNNGKLYIWIYFNRKKDIEYFRRVVRNRQKDADAGKLLGVYDIRGRASVRELTSKDGRKYNSAAINVDWYECVYLKGWKKPSANTENKEPEDPFEPEEEPAPEGEELTSLAPEKPRQDPDPVPTLYSVAFQDEICEIRDFDNMDSELPF